MNIALPHPQSAVTTVSNLPTLLHQIEHHPLATLLVQLPTRQIFAANDLLYKTLELSPKQPRRTLDELKLSTLLSQKPTVLRHRLTSGRELLLLGMARTYQLEDLGEEFAFLSLLELEAPPAENQQDACELFGRFITYSPAPSLLLELDSQRVVAVNHSLLNLLAFTRDEVLGQKLLSLNVLEHPRLFEKAKQYLQTQAGFKALELQLRAKSGVWRTVLLGANAFDWQGRRYALMTLVDIGERKHTEEQLSKAIQASLLDAEQLSHAIMEKLLQQDAATGNHNHLQDLTEREKDVLELLARGWDNQQIAADLGLSVQTVRNYVSRIYEKLDLHSRAEAVVWARERGLCK